MLPILRDSAGKFTEFGDPGPIFFGDPAGRFAGLMPRHPPSARQTAAAKAALLALGMEFPALGRVGDCDPVRAGRLGRISRKTGLPAAARQVTPRRLPAGKPFSITHT